MPGTRVWLDAAPPDPAANATSSMPPVPPLPPSIPPRASASPFAQQNGVRRRSVPGRSRRRFGRDGSTSKSPEVISSLIDSFSTISVESAPNSEPAQPAQPANPAAIGIRSSSTPTVRHVRSFCADSGTPIGAYREVLAEGLLDVDDAAEPPVVRTAKHPSGFSELTAPKSARKDGQHPIRNYIRNPMASRSATSLISRASHDDLRYVGSLTADSGSRRRSLASSSRESFESRLSVKRSHPSLFTIGSRDARRSKDVDRRSKDIERRREASGERTSDRTDSFRNHSPARRTHSLAEPIKEESTPSPTIDTTPALLIGLKREGKRPVLEGSSVPAPIPQGPSVPSRRSSLRHQDIPTPPTKKRAKPANPPSQSASRKTSETLIEQEEPKSIKFDSLDGEDTEVTKRIKELKAKKEQRERESRTASIHAAPESLLRPDSLLTKEDMLLKAPPDLNNSASKLRKPPGNINVPPPGPLAEKATKDPSHLSTEFDQPLTPLTPTPLPINYSFVVQSLSQSPPSSRAPSLSGSLKQSTPSRRHSFAVGGRSAISRTTASKSIKETSGGRNIDLDKARTDSSSDLPRSSIDSASVREPVRPTVRRSNSTTGKKKRWSHPDLPLSVEKRSSVRSHEREPPRQQQQPETVAEERPSSVDSIDEAVESFISSPRLSQKIRHPQSGRIISFSEVGDPKGNAVFCCVGMGLTRYITAFYDELAVTLKLRLITPDRPGVGESQPDPTGTPLSWPDDVLAICSVLHISKFSILAHSAGAIYALATALRIPQHIRGRVHLLAPWIPPSQMAPIGLHQDPPPGAQLPKSQRFLRVLPAQFLKVANSGFLSATSASLSPNVSPNSRKKRKSFVPRTESPPTQTPSKDSPGANNNNAVRDAKKIEGSGGGASSSRPVNNHVRHESILLMDQQNMPNGSALSLARSSNRDLRASRGGPMQNGAGCSKGNNGSNAGMGAAGMTADFNALMEADPEFRREYDERLTLSIWGNATTNANPVVDLLVCLERSQNIGFRYVDITRAVVVHHGDKDTRVPVENVKWLGSMMRRCEVRVLEGEGHGLMASATVMGNVLTEMAREWSEWERMVQKGRGGL